MPGPHPRAAALLPPPVAAAAPRVGGVARGRRPAKRDPRPRPKSATRDPRPRATRALSGSQPPDSGCEWRVARAIRTPCTVHHAQTMLGLTARPGVPARTPPTPAGCLGASGAARDRPRGRSSSERPQWRAPGLPRADGEPQSRGPAARACGSTGPAPLAANGVRSAHDCTADRRRCGAPPPRERSAGLGCPCARLSSSPRSPPLPSRRFPLNPSRASQALPRTPLPPPRAFPGRARTRPHRLRTTQALSRFIHPARAGAKREGLPAPLCQCRLRV